MLKIGNHTHRPSVIRLAETLVSTDQELLDGDQARHVWAVIDHLLKQAPREGEIVIDFAGARRVGVDFLEALLQVLRVVRARHPERIVIMKIDDADPSIPDGLRYVLERDRNLLPIIKDGALRIIGHLTKAQADTLAVVATGMGVTSADVALQLHVHLNAASNRLRKLHDYGIISRREEGAARGGGRRFVYMPLPPRL